MLHINVKEIESLLKKEHPYWNEEAIHRQATDIVNRLDPCFEEPLLALLRGEKSPDYQYGEYSIWRIRAMRHCCDLDAILLLDTYIKDAKTGKALIHRR